MTSPSLSPASAPPDHALTWKVLAPLIAARRHRIRLWSPDTEKFSDTADLTDTLPTRPAAVYLFSAKSRTTLLPLDFDISRGGAAAVKRDLDLAARWLTACGGRFITDYNEEGGRHLLCPLAIGTTAAQAEIDTLVRVLAAHLPTLDINPTSNAAEGCISVPGTVAKRGGHRRLDGTLEQARDIFIERSAPDLLPRLYVQLGILAPSRATTPTHIAPAPTIHSPYTVGDGDDRQLAPEYVRTDPLLPTIKAFAERGEITPTDHRSWKSPSEARFATIVAVLDRGHSLRTLRELIAPGGPWHQGLGAAFDRYKYSADRALARDVDRAFDWLIANPLPHRRPQHEKKYPRGGASKTANRHGPLGPLELRLWLANAWRWADTTYAGKRYRWTVYAVLQSLAVHALRTGGQINGTWVVGVGGRSLSLGAGLLSEHAVWRVLKDLRDHVGAPLVLVRSHIGAEADHYALTSQNTVATDTAGRAERVRIEPVHDAWHALGHHLRRVYELIAYHGLTHRLDIYAAAAISRSTGDSIITELQTYGLIEPTAPSMVGPGTASLDDIATRHGLPELRQQRIQSFREQRAAWREWLQQRERDRAGSPETVVGELAPSARPSTTAEHDFEADYLNSVLANGPPEDIEQTEDYAIGLVQDILGATLITRRRPQRHGRRTPRRAVAVR